MLGGSLQVKDLSHLETILGVPEVVGENTGFLFVGDVDDAIKSVLERVQFARLAAAGVRCY